MSRILASLTAGLVLLHALLGIGSCQFLCADCALSMHESECSDAACPGDHSGDPCQCSLDCPSKCVYLPTQKVKSDGVASSSAALLTAPSAVQLANPSGGSLHGMPVGWTDAGPPLRLHLLHQILLI